VHDAACREAVLVEPGAHGTHEVKRRAPENVAARMAVRDE
jgi:hypothetical protein